MTKEEIIRNWILDPKERTKFDKVVSNLRILKFLFGDEDSEFDGIVGFLSKDEDKSDYYKMTIIARVEGIPRDFIVEVENISFNFMERLEKSFGPK